MPWATWRTSGMVGTRCASDIHNYRDLGRQQDWASMTFPTRKAGRAGRTASTETPLSKGSAVPWEVRPPRICPEGALRKPGAWPRCCGCGAYWRRCKA